MRSFFVIPVIFLLLLCSVSALQADEWAREKLEELREMSSDPIPDELGRLLLMAGVQRDDGDRGVVKRVAHDKILGMQDLDEKLSSCISDERKRWKSGGTVQTYDLRRASILKSVSNIRDPRTVRFLGGMLVDREWTENPVLNLERNADWMALSPNAVLAAESLRKLVEQFPVHNSSYFCEEEDVAPWVAWYEEIRLGKRTFSFVGEKKRYRFKPDGSWEVVASDATLANGESLAGRVNPVRQRELHDSNEPTGGNSSYLRIWITGLVSIILLGGYVSMRQKKTR